MKFDDDVRRIVDDIVFQGLTLERESTDISFKREFINKFLYREIAFQTLELFSSQVCYNFMINMGYLNRIYDDLEDYIQGKSLSESSEQGDSTNDNRYLSSSLPQTEVNLNVDNTVLDYGDTNTISRTKDQRQGSSNATTKQFNIDNLLKTRGLKDDVFTLFDSRCFLQIW